jgi:hypothetical protein
VLVEVEAEWIPFALLGLERFKLPFAWSTPEDEVLGRAGINRFQEGLLMGMADEIVKAVDRVYMAVRQLSTGQLFIAGDGGTQPVIPPVPPELPPEVNIGLLALLRDMQGQNPGGWFGIGADYTSLADVATGLRAGNGDDVDRVNHTLELLSEAGNSATIFNTVRGLLTDTASLGEQGGMLAVMIASSMAGAATAGLQAAQIDTLIAKLDRLITSLDGGGADAPGPNVVAELGSINTMLGG